jgi:hypothetical protein
MNKTKNVTVSLGGARTKESLSKLKTVYTAGSLKAGQSTNSFRQTGNIKFCTSKNSRKLLYNIADKYIDKSINDRNLSGIKTKSKANDETLEGKDMELDTLDYVKRKLNKKNETKQKYDSLNFSNTKVNLTQGISKNL